MATTKKTQQKLLDSIRATKAGAKQGAGAAPAKPAAKATPRKPAATTAAKKPAPARKPAAASRSGDRPRGEAPRPPVSPFQSAGCRVWPD